jgi:trimeric autotransporter adhesin
VFSGDTVILDTSAATGTFASDSVGNGITVTVAGLTISGPQAGDYTLTQPTTAANITPANLTVSAITAADKPYNATTAAILNTSGATLVGVFSGDTVTLNTGGATGTFASDSVGNGITVTVAGLTIGGAQAGDYTLTQPTTAANITPANLTVSAISAADKPYNATIAAILNTSGATLVGVFSGDTVTLDTSAVTGTFASDSVGNGITVAVAGLTISGAQAGDYTLTQPTTAANITPANLTVSGITAADKQYNATTGSILNTSGATLVGVFSGETVILDTGGATATFATQNVGNGITVTVAGLTISGAEAGDYALTQPTTTANINPAPLAVTASDNQSMIYGGAVPAFTFTYTGLVGGDTSASFTGSLSTTATPASRVGPYAITQGSLAATGNYEIGSFNQGTITVNAARLLLTAGNETKTYGDTFAFAGTEFSTTGLVNGDTVTGVTLTSAGAAPTAGVGGSPYAIIPSAAVGSGLSNYAITYNPGTLTVDPASLTIMANDATKVAGQESPVFSVQYSGFVLGQGPGVLGGTLTFTTTATAGSSPGSYPIVPSGLTSSNYTITYVKGALDVSASNSTSSQFGSAPPLVTVTGLDWTTVRVSRKKSVKELLVTFSGALNASDADNLAAYTLEAAVRKKKVTVYSKPVRLNPPSYNSATNTVTLPLRGKPPAKTMQLTIIAAGLLDAEGRELDGNNDGRPGGNFVATLTKGGVISMARSTAEVRAHQVTAAVDALMADGFLRMIRRQHGYRQGTQ